MRPGFFPDFVPDFFVPGFCFIIINAENKSGNEIREDIREENTKSGNDIRDPNMKSGNEIRDDTSEGEADGRADGRVGQRSF